MPRRIPDDALRCGVAWLATASAPLAVRFAAIHDARLALTPADAAGIASDVAVAALPAGLLCALGRSRIAAVLQALVLLVWALLHHAAYEHLHELGAGLRFTYVRYVFEPAFAASLGTPTRPGLLLALLGGAIAGAAAMRKLEAPGRRAATGLALLGALGWLATALAPQPIDTLPWRTRHFAPGAVAALFDAAGRGTSGADLASLPPAARAAFLPDLSGEPIAALPRPGTNVLLLVIEGVAGPWIDAVAREAGLTPATRMPALSAWARRGLFATTFVTHQRQTNRGLYALLCGDYPKLGSAQSRMSEQAATGRERRCLPRVLRDAGYRTQYLQSAPLAFMFKDRFMRSIGFEQVDGDASFRAPERRSSWGVDDGTLFRETLARVRALRSERTPWLLTTLSVGTHHPFTVPDSIRFAPGGASLGAAVGFLDGELGALLDALAAEGALEDTLVLIASDESRGLERADDDLTLALSQNWGAFVALLPGREHGAIRRPVGQIDVALTVLDYLGIPAARERLAGRSALRAYGHPRELWFSNTHQRRSGAVRDDGTLYVCDERATRCEKFRAAPQAPFAPPREPLALRDGELEERRAIIDYTLRSAIGDPRRAEYPLLAEAEVPLLGQPRQRIFGGTNIDLPADTAVEVEFVARLEGDPRGSVTLAQGLRDRRRSYLARQLPALYAGDRLTLRYAFAAHEPIEALKVYMQVQAVHGDGMRLRVERARARLRPIGEGEGPAPYGLLGPVEVDVERAGLAERARPVDRSRSGEAGAPPAG